MEERKGDARVSVISGLFLACIIAGGVFLFMYMLLPEENSKPWYPFAGMVLVAIPWAFWLLTCVYRCFRPAGVTNGDSGRYAKAGSSKAATIPTTSGALTAGNVSATGSPRSPEGERKVQFAGVVVMGNADHGGRGSEKGSEINHQYQTVDMEHHNGTNDSVGSADSEMPLRLMV